MQYSIFINGQACDILSSTKPEFSRQVNNIGDPSEIRADNVIGLDLPDTNLNRVLTRQTVLADNDSNFEKDYFRVDVIYDGVPLIDNGKGQIDEVLDKKIRIAVISGNANVFQLIDNLNLNDLRFPELDHLYRVADVTNRMNGDWTQGYIYPVLDYGRTILPSVYDKVIRMYPDDDQNIFPAMFERYVFEAIFAAQGYTISGDVLNDTYFLKCIIPFTNEFFRNGARYAEENAFTSPTGSGFGVVNITGDTVFVIDDINIIPIAGTSYVIVNTASISVSVNASIVVNQVITGGDGGYYDAQAGILLNGVLTDVDSNGFFNVSPGDILQLAIVISTTSLPASPTNDSTLSWVLTNGYFFTSGYSNLILYNNEVQMEAQLPEMSQIDYVKSVMNRFGMIVQTDNLLKNCNFYSIEEVINRKFGAYDWTDRLNGDYSRKQTRIEEFALTNIYAYASDDTALRPVNILTKTYPYGSGSFNLNDNTLQNVAEKIELEFAGTFDISPTGVLNEWLGQILHWVETSTPTVYEAQEITPRCLYLNYKLGINIAIDAGIFGTISMPNAAIGNFSIPISGTNLDFNNLLQRYYPLFIDRVLGNCRKFEVWCYLYAIDISQFDFKRPVYFSQFGGYFYVEQIQSFIGNDSPTKLFLTKV